MGKDGKKTRHRISQRREPRDMGNCLKEEGRRGGEGSLLITPRSGETGRALVGGLAASILIGLYSDYGIIIATCLIAFPQ
jgi:hypothetical protein